MNDNRRIIITGQVSTDTDSFTNLNRFLRQDDEYIDEQEAKGRKPAMNWIVEPVNKWLGFKPRSKQYCFVGMMIRYCFCAIPLMFLVGMKFFACAFAIPFIYNAMFWVELPNTKYCSSPTNWGEWFSGLIIGWALM